MDRQKNALIITSTVAPSWIYPDAKNNPKTADDAIEEAVSAWKAGAAVIHIHGRMNFTEEEWARVIKTLRDKTDAIIQVGLSALKIPERLPVIKMKPDMLSNSRGDLHTFRSLSLTAPVRNKFL